MKKRILLLAAALCLLCSGCGGGLLEREWSSVTPHSAGYWENGDKDTLRADSYQDAVNAILMLVANHAERGVVRCYFGSDAEYAELAAEACNEVQQETDLGAYLLDYITYAGTDERGFYELTLSFGYRRTAEEQEGIINATSTEAIPDLLRAAAAEGADRLVVRVSYFPPTARAWSRWPATCRRRRMAEEMPVCSPRRGRSHSIPTQTSRAS